MKYIFKDFDIELARQITNNSLNGEIFIRDNNGDMKLARIICFDFMEEGGEIIALARENNFREKAFNFNSNGQCVQDHNKKIILKIPEYCTFRDGDVISFNGDNNVAILKSIDYKNNSHSDYVTYFYSNDNIYYDTGNWALDKIRKANATEIMHLYKKLEKSSHQNVDFLKEKVKTALAISNAKEYDNIGSNVENNISRKDMVLAVLSGLCANQNYVNLYEQPTNMSELVKKAFEITDEYIKSKENGK